MRRIIIITGFLFVYGTANAQMEVALPGTISKEKLSQQFKSEGRRLKTTGLVLLAVGAGLYAFGSSQFKNDWGSSGSMVLGLAGLAMVPASIPCFIIGGNRTRKARLLMQNEEAPLFLRKDNGKNIRGLSLAVNL
jgi:hypothetical protein